MGMDFEELKNPGAEYRGKPFWAWNGKIEKEELEFQINCLKEMGFGGAFLHSRTGLETEYMSEEWRELIGYAAEKLQEKGMEAYLYDEDRWPSGTCGGEVTRTKEFRAKSMIYEEITDRTKYIRPENFLGLFAVETEGRGVKSYRKISCPKEAKEGEKVLSFRYIYMQGDSFYNGYTYIDTMNLEATERFIELTHERYKKSLGDKFGKEIMGIFTDEPHRGPLLNGFGRKEKDKEKEIPYTYCLFKEFENRKGYKIEDRLPLLWLGKAGEPFCKEMYDFIEVEEELFLENFAKPYYEWCRRNNLLVTGHVLHEDNLASQTTMCGSVMRYYEYMDYPGMDNLCELNYAYNVPALVRSAARQLGKKFVLDELYAATGWKMRLADYKHTGDWQSATGVTLRCPHLSWYTMKGEAKRDYPASILHQSAWYKDFSTVEDYFARMHYLMTLGESAIDTAIINPVESTWGLTNEYAYKDYFAATQPLYQRIEKEYYELYKGLLLRGAEVDYIDEGLFAKYGKAEGAVLCCGKAGYKKIILNGNLNLRSTTLKELNEFIKEGGKVYVVGEKPCYLDGEAHDFTDELSGAVKTDFDVERVYEYIRDTEVETEERRLIVSKRVMGEEKIILFLNSSREESFDAEIVVRTNLNCMEIDLRTGEYRAAEYIRTNEGLKIKKHFDRDEEYVLFLTRKEEPLREEKKAIEAVSLPESFDYSLDEPNFLVLDNAEFYIDGERQGNDYVLNIDRKIREKFGLEARHGEMIQPWYKKKYFPVQDKKYCRAVLVYRFDCESIPEEAEIMTEEYRNTQILLNGQKLDISKAKRTKIDNCFRITEIPFELFRSGENEIEISFDFYEETGIEGIFLCGKFGVRKGEKKDTVIPLAEKLKAGDLCLQGLTYYGGRVTLNVPMPNGKYLLESKDLACALIIANGKRIAFPPYRAETEVIEEKLKIELVMTRNNLFGCSDENGNHSRLLPQGLCFPIELYKVKNPSA